MKESHVILQNNISFLIFLEIMYILTYIVFNNAYYQIKYHFSNGRVVTSRKIRIKFCLIFMLLKFL